MDSKEATTQPISEVSSGDSRSDSKGTVPEDEGYVSGNEEFEPASDKLVVDEIVEEENSDELEKIESLLISGVVVNDDDDVEKGDKDIEGGGVLEGDKVGGVEGFDRNGEVLDSVEKLGVNSNDGVDGEEGKVGVREAEMKVEESEVNEKSEPQAKDASQAAVVEHVESEFSDAVDVKTTPEGDAVVDAIQVDVAAPGVVVVGETEEDGDAGNEPEKEVISEVAVIEQEKSEVVSLVNEGQTSQGDPVAVDETEPKEENLTSVDKLEPKEVAENVGLADVALASEGDSVVDAIQVDKVGPGVVVVGELEGEKIEGVEVPLVSVSGPTETADDVEEVGTREVLAANIVDVVDADENSDAVGVVDLENGVHASSESNDSVDSGDTIKKPEVEFESPRIPDSRIAGKARPIIVGINNLEVEGGGEPESAPISEAVENSTTPKIATDGEVEGEVNPRENTGKAPPVVIGRSSPKVEEDVEYESAPISEVAENSITAKIAADGEVEGELDGLSNTVTVPPVVIEPNNLQVEDDVEYESAPISEAVENSTTAKTATYGEVEGEAGDSRNTGTAPPVVIGRNDPPVEDDNGEEVNPEDSMSDEDSDGMIFGSSEAAKKFIEELERESVEDSHAGGEGSLHQSRGIDGQIVTDSEEEEEEEEDGPSGAPLSYDVFVSQRSHVVQQSIGHAVGDLRMMSPSLMNPVSLVENHPSCRKNRDGHKILPNGQIWRPQLLLLCYSMKILSEASSLSKPQDPFDHRKLFGMRQRAPPLPYMLSSMLQTRTHPKLQSDQGGDSVDSDIDLDEDLSDDDQEGVDEYDQLPPFKPLKKAQMAKLTAEQRKAYFEEYDYRVKLLQKKQWREELKRMREMKKNGGKDAAAGDYAFAEDDADAGAAAPIAVPLPDMALPPSFDGDNPAYRFRFLEPTSQFLARPVLDNHGWDHDCGYDGVNLEHSLAIASRFPAVYTVQVTKDKKDFSISLDSSVSAKYGDDISTMAGFDIQSMGKQLAYIFRGEAKIKNLKKHRATGGLSFTLLGENVVPGVKIEDQISLGKQYSLSGSAGAVRSQQDTAYGANFELQRRELDYPIGQVQSTLSVSVVKWRGDLALGLNSLAQFSLGRNSKVAVRAGINNKLSGQITVRTSSSEHLSLALTAIIPTVLSVYKKFFAGGGEKYPIY
ncbi:hypothetical protein ABFS82_04G019200 [Erythranthe guttata]